MSPDGGRILVVDDSPVNRMILTKALSAVDECKLKRPI